MANSPAKSGLDVGSVIADTYTIEGMIGRGGMGAVFRASHARLPGRYVAIKVLHPDIADPESLARFRREAEIASRLGHPNIVEVLDWNALPDGTPYIVLELMQGVPLSTRVAQGPIPLEQTYTIVRQVGSALAAAHAHEIVHRDLKPANVFLVPTEADGYLAERAKVLDFGISKIRGSQTVKTQDSAILGTPQYMAPEQALGNHAAVDQRTDVFALGAMVYEMLSGKAAFGGSSIPEVVFKVVYEEPPPLTSLIAVPPHVAAAVAKAMAKKSDDRFPSVSAFVEALTGAPLATMRRAAVAAPEGVSPSLIGAPRTGPGAFDQTIGSGDHGAAVGVAQTMASGDHGAQLRGGVAATAQGAVAAVAAVAPVTGSPMTTLGASAAQVTQAPVAAPAARSKTPLILGVALIVAIAAVAIAVVVSRGGGGGDVASNAVAAGGSSTAGATGSNAAGSTGSNAAGSTGSNAAGSNAAGSNAAGSNAVGSSAPGSDAVGSGSTGSSNAGSGSDSATGTGAGMGTGAGTGTGAATVTDGSGQGSAKPGSGSAVKPGTGSAAKPGSGSASKPGTGSASKPGGTGAGDEVAPPDGDGGGASDGAIAPLLAEAQSALRDGDSATADRLAKKAIHQVPQNPAAWAIRAEAACIDSDRERAMTALRHLDGRPAFKRRAIHACKEHGVDL